jgi:hypothetical protein
VFFSLVVELGMGLVLTVPLKPLVVVIQQVQTEVTVITRLIGQLVTLRRAVAGGLVTLQVRGVPVVLEVNLAQVVGVAALVARVVVQVALVVTVVFSYSGIKKCMFII